MGSGLPENDSRPLSPDSINEYLAGCFAASLHVVDQKNFIINGIPTILEETKSYKRWIFMV